MKSKADLPTKTCPVCKRPFTWRKKWEKCWEEVKYCSDRCRNNKAGTSLSEVTSSRQKPLDFARKEAN